MAGTGKGAGAVGVRQGRNKSRALAGLALAAVMLAAGCGSAGAPSGSSPATPGPVSSAPGLPSAGARPSGGEVTPGSVYQGPISVLTPEAPGTAVYAGGGVTIDASNASEGYVMVKCEGIGSRVKVRVTHGGEEYLYNINNLGLYEVLPLQMGSGEYEIKAFQQLEGTKYTPIYTASFNAEMPDEDRVFVYPSQYVWYTGEADAVCLSYDLCSGVDDPEEMTRIIYDYLVGHMSYDYDKAADVASGTLVGYIPDLGEVLAAGKGICFDYAGLLAAMLRAHEIPVRLVIGYLSPDGIYHAWNQVYLEGEWVWMDATLGPRDSHTEENYAQDRVY